MHSTDKLASFMTLRANGWSLDKIAKQINVSKTTLWSWDVKNQNEIHLLKHMQLERVQEQYLPSYEEELKSLSTQLTRVEEALGHQDLSTLPPAFLLQMSLQIRERLSKMRQQAPLRTVQYGPIQPLPVTGCVTKDENYPWIAGDPAIEAAEEAAEAAAAQLKPPATAPCSVGPAGQSASPAAQPSPELSASKPSSNGHTNGPRLCDPQQHLNGNGKPHLNGRANGKPATSRNDSTHLTDLTDSTSPIRVDSSSFVGPNSDTKTEQNRTKREGGQSSDPSESTTSKHEN